MWHPTKGPPCGLFFRNSLHVDGLALTDIYQLIPFLRVRNLGVAYWGDSGLGFLMRLPPSCWLPPRVAVISRLSGSWRIRFQAALRGCWQEASVSHWLLARGLRSSPHGPLHRMFQCPQDVKAGSPWGIGPKEKERERVWVIKIKPKTEARVSLVSEWWTITPAISYWPHKPPLVECGSGPHEDVNTGRWGPSRAIVESGCHSLEQPCQMTVQTAVSPQPWKQNLH